MDIIHVNNLPLLYIIFEDIAFLTAAVFSSYKKYVIKKVIQEVESKDVKCNFIVKYIDADIEFEKV